MLEYVEALLQCEGGVKESSIEFVFDNAIGPESYFEVLEY